MTLRGLQDFKRWPDGPFGAVLRVLMLAVGAVMAVVLMVLGLLLMAVLVLWSLLRGRKPSFKPVYAWQAGRGTNTHVEVVDIEAREVADKAPQQLPDR